MACKGNCGENGGITNKTTEKEKWHCRLKETKKKTKDQETDNYVMIFCGVPANQCASSALRISVRKDWKHKMQDYTWISDRIIETRIKVLNRNFTIVEVYAPAEGKEHDTEEFYRELQQSTDKIPY